MRLFCLTLNGDREYVSAYTPIQALKFYCEEFGYSIQDFKDDDNIIEISQFLWKTISVQDTENEGHLNMEDLMQGIVKPELIATSYE